MAKKISKSSSTNPAENSEHIKYLLVLAVLLVSILLLGVGFLLGAKNTNHTATLTPTIFPQDTMAPLPTQRQTTFISSSPNPASAFCLQQGGKLQIQTRGDGGQYGLCNFEDAMSCEEWAMFRGDCPVGGVKTTGFDTIEQKYCAWSGGNTLAVENATCTFANGSVCDDKTYYNGTCTK